MTKTRKCLALVALLVPTIVYAQEPKVHSIEKALETCTEKDPSTAGVVRCTDRAYQMWDKELNKNYAALIRKLNPEGKQTLKAAQLEWIKYRDAEFKLTDSVYDTLQGTMYIPMRIDHKKEIVKNRAEDLARYLDLVSESEP